MFTGIIEEIGKIGGVEGLGDEKRLTIECAKVLADTKPGDSIAIDGSCLTVTDLTGISFTAHVSSETLSRTTLGDLKPGDGVNLERAMTVGDRFGGHMVLGHVDGVGTIKSLKKTGEGMEANIESPPEILAYLAPKGSITLAGISLTVVSVEKESFTTALVPFTLEHTTLADAREGDRLNIEVDVIARYVKRLIDTGKASEGISMGKLIEGGFV